jgi:GntR family transcriptional regulator/MocR family aminotransferase
MSAVRPRGPRALAREVQLVAAPGEGRLPLHQRLYRQLRGHILEGRLAAGAMLPSARTLAADLRLSRNTVESALAQLVAEGFVERRVGAGTRVSATVGDAAPFLGRAATTPGAAPPRAVRPSRRGAVLARHGEVELVRDHETGTCATDLRRFPSDAWNRLFARQLRRSGTAHMVGGDPLGLPALRHEIVRHVAMARGVRCAPDQVLVVGSTQEALDLVARVVLDPGDAVLMEDPGYPSARAAFLASGARVHPVPVDAEGVRVAAGPTSARLLYVTPSHQFPLGVHMSLARRLEVLEWAARTRGWVVEDDYDSEFRYDGRPLAALQSLDDDERVLYLGTYNKVLFPGLRLAYLVLPRAWVRTFAAARRLITGGAMPLAQAVLAEFLASGRFAAYLRQARHHYGRRRDLLLATVPTLWGGRVRLGPSATGLHLVAHLAGGVDDRALALRARAAGLAASPLSGYVVRQRRLRGLVMSYGPTDRAALGDAVRDLAPVVRALPLVTPTATVP